VVTIVPLNPSQTGDTTLPIAIRNSTNDAVSHLEITGSARTPTRKLIANGNSQGTTPATLQPG
jgi:hypothetical protein